MSTGNTKAPGVAIVTGAASGIGARAVERLRDRAVRVVAADVQRDLESKYAGDTGVRTVVGDITADGFAESVVELAQREFGEVDRLVHCAGIMPGGQVADVAVEKFELVMRVNYVGTVRMTKAVLPSMRARRSGEIVVLGSLTGYVPTAGFSAYSASKAAVDSYTETLSHEERAHGIHVLLAAPNAVKTPLLAQATGGPSMVAKLNEKDSSPLMVTPDDVLDAIDKGLAKKKTVVIPGGRAMYAVRRLSPNLTWALAARFGG
ncbi:SDR family NAD(P)-dependent oxidoreductase [Gordonia terrae]